MTARLRRLFRNPAFLLGLVAFLAAFVVQSGELGSSDTTHRLQATHSFWTSEPPVDPKDYPDFGIHGRNGKLYGWYGIGQSLLMLPADIVGTYIERLPVFDGYDVDPTVRDIFVSYTTNILICVLSCIWSAFGLLGLFGFSVNQQIAGVLGADFLHHVSPLHAEHDGEQLHPAAHSDRTHISVRMASQRRPPRIAAWLARNRRKLAHSPDHRIGLARSVSFSRARVVVLGNRAERSCVLGSSVTRKSALPVYAIFVLLDRLYQYQRFGSFFTTYMSVFGSRAEIVESRAARRRIRLKRRSTWDSSARCSRRKNRSSCSIRCSCWRCPLRGRVEALSARNSRISDRFWRALARVHLLLRHVHGLERRFRVGRPLRFHGRAVRRVHLCAAADAPPRGGRQNRVELSGSR